MLKCVNITPLDRPVVPLEYGSAAMSSLASIATGGGVAGERSMSPQNELDSPDVGSITTMRLSAGAPSRAASAI